MACLLQLVDLEMKDGPTRKLPVFHDRLPDFDGSTEGVMALSNDNLAKMADELVGDLDDAEMRNRMLREAGLVGVPGARFQGMEGNGPEAMINRIDAGED